MHFCVNGFLRFPWACPQPLNTKYQSWLFARRWMTWPMFQKYINRAYHAYIEEWCNANILIKKFVGAAHPATNYATKTQPIRPLLQELPISGLYKMSDTSETAPRTFHFGKYCVLALPDHIAEHALLHFGQEGS
jgi:hypothetical protein